MSKQALGKGLSALISSDEDELVNKENIQPYQMQISVIKAGRSQPRGHFEEKSLLELAESIKKNGILQPILVRKLKDGNFYEIIAGERRFRAAKTIGLKTVPVIVKDLDDKQSLELALIENIQRENLTAIEEAEGYKRLQEEFSYTQEQLGGVLGKSRSHIANMLRLLSLPQPVKEMLESGLISMGHARVLVGKENASALAARIVREGLNVREAEKFSENGAGSAAGRNANKVSGQKNTTAGVMKDEELQALERIVSENLGLRVVVENGPKGGKIVLYFDNLQELDKILQKIG